MNDPTARHALVIGAGLAGVAVGVSLVRRGWHVTLLDAADGPAQGASALPVGMLSPHVTRAPTPLSRLSALGVADMREQLQQRLPQGEGWQACEVDNLGHDPGRWPAALVRPAAIIQAWIKEAEHTGRLRTLWHAPVARLVSHPTEKDRVWVAQNTHGQELAQASHAVVAGALGSLTLLNDSLEHHNAHTLPLRPVKGQMSLGPQPGLGLAPRPLRNNGVFVPLYEDTGLPPAWPSRIWSMGSTYRRGDNSTGLSELDHQQNLQSLQALHPAGAAHMQNAARLGELLGWAQVRCASLDRLPLVGAVPDVPGLHQHMAQARSNRSRLAWTDTPRLPGLFMLTALGSRGLTLAHWCATQLALQMEGVASTGVQADLLQALDPARFAWREARKAGKSNTSDKALGG